MPYYYLYYFYIFLINYLYYYYKQMLTTLVKLWPEVLNSIIYHLKRFAYFCHVQCIKTSSPIQAHTTHNVSVRLCSLFWLRG